MNLESIGRLIESRYDDVQRIADGPVFRASRNHRQASVGVYYFDCSKTLLRPTFDLSEYQERLLSDEYYSQTGPLQWNLYLYLLCDDAEYLQLLNEGLVSRIESDGIYAKKYVTSEDLLRQELSLRAEKWHRETAELPEDIGARWLMTLEHGGLADIADQRVPAKEVFRRYMGTTSLPDRRRRRSAGNARAAALSFLTGIRLEIPRPYPRDREFEFGPVNLIEGANGAGKTSLLEAIELWACGRTFRNYGGEERASDIWLKSRGGSYVRGNRPGDNELYRGRDLLWYGNHQSKGTDLCFRFNRFNFYNTDAAIDITNASDSDTINKAIADLVLGEEANVIESRLRTLLSYFEPERRTAARDVESLRTQGKEADEALKSLGPAPDEAEGSIEALREELRRLGLGGVVDVKDDGTLDVLTRELSAIAARIEECRAELSWLPTISLSAVSSERQRINLLLAEVKNISQQMSVDRKHQTELQEKVEALNLGLADLDAWRVYLFNESASSLRGLEQTINQALRHKKACEEASEVVADINFTKYLEAAKPLEEAENNEQAKEREVRSTINGLKRRLRQIEKERGRFSALLSEIRLKSSELLKLDPNITNCPVCNKSYAVGQLIELLTAQHTETEQYASAREEQEALAQAERQAIETSNRLDELQRIRYAYSLVVSTDADVDWQLGGVARRLQGIREELTGLDHELDKFVWLKKQLEQEGLTEANYETLRGAVKRKFPDAPLDYIQRGKFEAFRTQVAEVLEGHEAALQEVKERLEVNAAKIDSLYGEYFFATSAPANSELELRKRAEQLQRWEPIYQQLMGRTGALANDTIADLSVRVREAKARCDRQVDSRRLLERTSKLLEKYASQKKESIEKLPDAQHRLERASEAVEIINSILIADNKEGHLQKFFESNTTDIFEIYRLLHAPREFTGVEYDSEGRIVLVRNTGERSLLTQISSGQRAALSLSIFLALNRKLRNGPPFILFDDPVALVDDLNVLSFLDYLRDIVLAGDRQIFFATANQKVATLCRKKFAFLDGEFKDIRLMR